MMNKFKRIIKKVFCKHDYEMVKEIALDTGVIMSLKCILCDKTKILIEYDYYKLDK